MLENTFTTEEKMKYKPKLNLQKAEEIRTRFRARTLGKQLAYEYGVSKSTISMVVQGRIWNENRTKTSPPRARSASQTGQVAG
jgi:hypothetical protein